MKAKKTVSEANFKTFGDLDLSKIPGSVTEIFTTNFERFGNCRTFEDVVALCHELLDGAGLNTEWTRKFFYRLAQIKEQSMNPRAAFEKAMTFVNNTRMKGMGLGMDRGGSRRRFYENVSNITVKAAACWLDDDDQREFIEDAKRAGVTAVFNDGGDYDSSWTMSGPEAAVKKFIEDNFQICPTHMSFDELMEEPETDIEILNESMDDKQKEDFKKKLREGKVEFKYKKKDGTERKAIGTMDPKLMDLPEKKTQSDVDGAEKKKVRKLPIDSVFYYDLEAKGFRSFKMENFIDYIK